MDSVSETNLGKLLRVPKAGTKAFPHEVLQKYWEEIIKPEFEEQQLVQQSLVQLLGTNVVPRLNEVLSKVEGRRKDFEGSTVGDAEFAMLVEDMRKVSAGSPCWRLVTRSIGEAICSWSLQRIRGT